MSTDTKTTPAIRLDGADLAAAMVVASAFGAKITAQTMSRAIEAALARHHGVVFIWPAWERT